MKLKIYNEIQMECIRKSGLRPEEWIRKYASLYSEIVNIFEKRNIIA